MSLRVPFQSRVIILGLVLLSAKFTLTVQAQEATAGKSSDYDRAVALYQSGNDELAIDLLQKVVSANGKNADAWYLLGLASYRSGMLWRAGDAFTQVLALRPNQPDERARVIHAKLAYTSILSSQSDQAVAHAQRALDLGDLTPEPFYAIAEAKLRAGDYEVAVTRASEALKHDPKFAVALITRGMALFFLKRYPEAAASFEEFVAQSSDGPENEVWREQLEKIRSYGKTEPNAKESATSSQEQVFAGRDVTTKVRVTDKPEPTYTEAARQAGVTGTIILRSVFSSSGKVTNIFVWQALSHGLNARAINAARQIKFVPATKDGKPVSMWIELQYNFNLY